MTRDTLEDKKVIQLSYECYVPMALKEMERIAQKFDQHTHDITNSYSSSFGSCQCWRNLCCYSCCNTTPCWCYEASRYAIDTLKEQVPIFKKEIHEGGSMMEGQSTFVNLMIYDQKI